MAAALIALLLPSPVAAQSTAGTEVPATFDGGLVDVLAPTAGGTNLRMCTDTGGGILVLRRTAADGAGLLPGNGTTREVPFPEAWTDGSVPPPVTAPARLKVLPESKTAPLDERCDGMLGAPWFAGRTWTLDYPDGRLLVRRDDDGLPDDVDGRHVPLGFQVDSTGSRTSQLPRIDVVVEGDSLPVLLDTGAHLIPTERARRALGVGSDGPSAVATSFIEATIFARWRREHPEWRVVARSGMRVSEDRPMIRVPEVEVGGLEVGPVWFVRRPDRSMEHWLSRWMDETVVGAIGGSALRYLRLTISYPEAVAVVSLPNEAAGQESRR